MLRKLFESKLAFLLGFTIGALKAIIYLSLKNSSTEYINYGKTNTKDEKKIVHYEYSNDFFKPTINYGEDITKHISFQLWMNEERQVTYDRWFSTKKLSRCNINMDNHVYGPKNKSGQMNELLEFEWLKSEVHITCVIFVKKKKLAYSIQNTWGKNCNSLYFFSRYFNESLVPIIKFDKKVTSSWQLLCESMNYIWNKNSNDSKILQWIIFVNDDTMVILENLRYMVAPLDFNKDHYLGHPVILWGQTYNIAQSGYVLSRGAFVKVVQHFSTSQKCADSGKYWKMEDYYLGKHLHSFGIPPSDTRDELLRGTFHGFSLKSQLWGISKASYGTRSLYPVSADCCSTKTVTFNVAEATKVYTFYYLLYNVNVYKEKGIYGGIPAVTPYPIEQVWKKALKEEFNITEVDYISNEQYYQIWKEKYSEADQLIAKIYTLIQESLDILSATDEPKSNGINASVIPN
ncbi:C1GALT1-specific chaperone 1-like protein [Prorops nasuta]|uniref:C1GALT1-specific chaperone 1-like protein n=1 Tax=Prorops nasuta TaxID=863751 RepID=UPI0034CD0B44